jgi:hypothetical protein
MEIIGFLVPLGERGRVTFKHFYLTCRLYNCNEHFPSFYKQMQWILQLFRKKDDFLLSDLLSLIRDARLVVGCWVIVDENGF